MIQHQQEKYNWEFIFLGANIDAAKEAGNIGISEDNAFNFEATKNGIPYVSAKFVSEMLSYSYRFDEKTKIVGLNKL